MRSAKAPEGFHTWVDVHVRLKNGQQRWYAWSTPIALSQALHKGLSWARERLSEDKVPGRSSIVHVTCTAEYRVGHWDAE